MFRVKINGFNVTKDTPGEVADLIMSLTHNWRLSDHIHQRCKKMKVGEVATINIHECDLITIERI